MPIASRHGGQHAADRQLRCQAGRAHTRLAIRNSSFQTPGSVCTLIAAPHITLIAAARCPRAAKALSLTTARRVHCRCRIAFRSVRRSAARSTCESYRGGRLRWPNISQSHAGCGAGCRQRQQKHNCRAASWSPGGIDRGGGAGALRGLHLRPRQLWGSRLR